MRRQHIIVGVVFVAVVAALLSVYQFYLKDKFQAYSQDQEKLKKYEAKLKELEDTFSGIVPDTVVSIWEGAVNPWREAVQERAEFFNVEQKLGPDDIPEEGILKFYYEEELSKRILELRQEAINQQVYIPQTAFGAPTPTELSNKAPTKAEVLTWLNQVDQGCAVTRMLMKARPAAIMKVEPWPEYNSMVVLKCNTFGIEMYITLENLLRFLSQVNRDDSRYYSIDEIQIRSRQLRSYQDPPLEVSLLLTQAVYAEPNEGQEKFLAALNAAAATGGPGGGAADQFASLRADRGRREDDPRSQRKRKSWFRKYFWPFDWP